MGPSKSEPDGLKRDWHGRVFLNPPYHRDLLPLFIERLITELEAGRITAAIMLTNNCTDTNWFLQAQSACSAICFTCGRIKFTQGDGVTEVMPTQGQAFFYFGNDVARFIDAFNEVGFVMVPATVSAKARHPVDRSRSGHGREVGNTGAVIRGGAGQIFLQQEQGSHT
jgi:DNA N-6-adenine-methyltransferase (Dam)